MRRQSSQPGPLLAALVCLATATAHANGRMPGATGLAIHPRDGAQLLLGLTFGLALSRDGGASWAWMCEQQIEGNGSNVDPSIVMTGDGTLVVVSLTNGGVLVSRDDGCSFERAMGPLQGHRGVDLTLDPGQAGRVLALMSRIVAIDERNRALFRNFVAHSLDHGSSWEVLAELPDDMRVETLEVAPSDPSRIYVSGTETADPLQGIVMRSDDGGDSWMESTVELPFGSGSLFVSGIHPTDPDTLWFRVPGLGDLNGVLPARLWLSTDGAASFEQIADTGGGMLGFAVSPRGDRVAFGGPLDGLFVAPADGSAPASRVADLVVTCLRWHGSGLYTCALEPNAPYSLAHAVDPAAGFETFVPVWQRAETCPAACASPSTLERTCRRAWEEIAPLVGAETALCDGPAPEIVGQPEPDGGAARLDGGVRPRVEASPVGPGATGRERARRARAGCGVMRDPAVGAPAWQAWLAAFLMLAARLRGTRRREAPFRPCQ
ncbi:MAG: hypothetical protein OXT09_01160 [Myxococcales bacterium]|nr:hypothetical protein [Myxococcales bacterium]